MSGQLNVVTGATGLLGSHIAEQLLAQGHRVRAITRPTSNTSELAKMGAELAPVGLHDPAGLRVAFAGTACVYHCAACVSDWSAWRDHQRDTIDATRNVLDACRAVGVGRVVHASSVLVYGHPRGERRLDETEPLGQHLRFWDYYPAAKIEAEKLVAGFGSGATIIRPTWLFGPRDQRAIPRLVKALRARGRGFFIGNGQQLLNMLHAADVARGAILAANSERARGEAYNLCSNGEITQKQMFDVLTNALGLPLVRRGVPYRFAYAVGLFSELVGFAIRLRRPPHLTRHGVAVIGRPPRFRAEKAFEHFGWRPEVGVEEGLRETIAWLLQQEAQAAPTS